MSYSSENIKSLSWQEQARTRPGMWIGSTGNSGVLHLINEAIDNSVDEVTSGYGSKILIFIESQKNGTQKITVRDFGRGIPVGLNEKGLNTLTSAATVMFTGGKYDNNSYKFSSGMHGSGLKLINAFSTYLKVTSYRDEKVYSQEFALGYQTSEIQTSEITTSEIQTSEVKTTGTEVSFIPDKAIFGNYKVTTEDLKFRCKCISSLIPNIEIIGNINGKEVCKYKESSELSTLIDEISLSNESLFRLDYTGNLSESDENHIPYRISLRLKYYPTNNKSSMSFCNTVYTSDMGSHDEALLKAIKDSIKKITGLSLNTSQISIGLSYVLSVNKREPVFRGQSKTRVKDEDIFNIVYKELYPIIHESLNKDKDFIKYFTKIINSQNKIIEETALKEVGQTIKESVRNNELPKSLKIAFGYKPEQRELILCEGFSAAGTVKEAALPYQEVLPLRGKVLNTAKADFESISKNKEVQDIFKAIGGMEGTNTQLRTHTVMILADSDPDGCLGKETKIQLCDGRQVPIQDLVKEKEFWVWASSCNGEIIPAKAHSARITKYVDELYKIGLSNEEIITCTNNHLFMKKDGHYVRADELQIGIPLMPSHRGNCGDREYLYPNSIETMKVWNEPVYDITSDRYHNFALSAGIIAHNSHIYSCIITLFAMLFPSFIKNHNLYVCHPPLFSASDGVNYVYANTAKSAAAKFKKKFKNKKFQIGRNKGLGEQNASDFVPMIHPDTRVVTKVEYSEETIEAIKAFMGNKSENRKFLLEDIEGYEVTSDSISFDFENTPDE